MAGSSPDDMLFAVNRIRELQGGFLTVKDGRILSELALQVCGLLSEKSIRENGLALKAVRKSLTDLGYVHNNPIMSVPGSYLQQITYHPESFLPQRDYDDHENMLLPQFPFSSRSLYEIHSRYFRSSHDVPPP